MLNQHALTLQQLSAKPSRRLINQALKDNNALNSTFIGQDRARDALAFGLDINARGYNLYVMGEQATGRFTLVREYIDKYVTNTETPDDWCYINNFEDEREPFALRLPAGESKRLYKELNTLLDELLDTFPAAFDNPGYQRKKAAIAREFEQGYDKAIDEVESLAQRKGVSLFEEGGVITFSPVVDGNILTDKDFAELGEEQRLHFYKLIDELEDSLSEALIELPKWKRASSEKLRALKNATAEQGIKPLLKKLEHKYAADLAILKFLRQLKPHLVETIVELLAEEKKDEKSDERSDDFDRRTVLEEQYLPNILVSHAINDGAPLIYEPNPSHQNLFGRIEYTNVQGSVYTNYRMIRPGALHKANGGYLLLDVDKLIEQPFAWETLKLVLKSGMLKMDIPQHDTGMVNSITLNPQQIPINVKVVLLGSRDLYYTLQEYDDEFYELFRVLVDFDHEIPLEKKNLFDFVGRVRNQVTTLGLSDISAKAMYRLVEFSLRLAEHQNRLSARFSEVIELLHEAAYFCRKAGVTQLDVTHIESALAAKTYRTGRVSEAVLDDIKQGQILIATDGVDVGKVNGLTVLEVGDCMFGTPARITSTVYAGSSGVVDIEREVELGQPIHSKGVLLLTGYLGHKYAQLFPLTLSANIAIEQSYGHIDGDSASLAELIALISALTKIPARQDLAITGSINQYGQVQSVGGVNEKIEGFFKLCQHRELSGKQGVIIPKSNQINLMLDKEIIAAVKSGKFHIYAVETVEQALELLMNKEAGQLNSKGRYPKGSINYTAVLNLLNIANIVSGGED
ncbi:MAG: AAA family ATPase [Paraglaciecola sp.]|uniref:Lon protease family protein n=1 Tax=Pseudomonadati TaxID=3379134 RepID=UPI00273FC32C|nr:ATP-binding protein [Paraglaciecola sp.]MDP5030277.1 AAA family ATPase [Paraglaciecola sp.]MDP5133827.1 AAA family ATPase [Paraglaciecola sp.]